MILPPLWAPVLRTVTTIAGAVVAVVGFLAHPAAALGGIVVSGFVAGGMALHLQRRPAAAPTRQRAVIAAGGTALWVWLIGTGAVTLVGGSLESALVTILLGGVPAIFHLRRTFRRSEPAAPAVPLPAAVPFPVFSTLSTLSTPELCLAWRRSYLTLVELPPGPASGELVAVRQSMLDELERRDSDGFHRWLDDGARASGDPGRYLAAGPSG